MYKRIHSNSSLASFMVASNPSYGEQDTVPIDQTPSKNFNIDPSTGRPMSQITSLLRAQSAVEMQAGFAALNEFKSNFIGKDISNEDALKYAMPSRFQLASEIAEFQEFVDRKELELISEEKRLKQIEDERKAFSDLVKPNKE